MCFLHVDVLDVQLETLNSDFFFHVVLSHRITAIHIILQQPTQVGTNCTD